MQRRTTYFEMATEDQVPKDLCDLHGGGVRTNVRSVAAGEWPRAALAVDVAAHTPVVMQGPTVVGDIDPYNSTQSLNNAVAARAPPAGELRGGYRRRIRRGGAEARQVRGVRARVRGRADGDRESAKGARVAHGEAGGGRKRLTTARSIDRLYYNQKRTRVLTKTFRRFIVRWQY